MDNKTKSAATWALSFSIMCLAFSIIYISLEARQWRKDLPEFLILTGTTADKLAPAVSAISEIGKMIPPILDEVAASRKVVDKTVEEVKEVRKDIPGILKEAGPITKNVENTVAQLPKVIDPVLVEVAKTREHIPDIIKEIQNASTTVEKAVVEVRLTREEIPEMMDRAEELIASAGEIGKEASKGALSGVVGGIVSMPFDVVGGIRLGASNLLHEEEQKYLTPEDILLLKRGAVELAEKGNVGQSKLWENKKSGNRGKVTLTGIFEVEGRQCRQFRIDTKLKGKKNQVTSITGCKQPDGSWLREDNMSPAK